MKMRYLKKLRICLWLIVPLMSFVGCRDGVNQRLASIDSLMDVWGTERSVNESVG